MASGRNDSKKAYITQMINMIIEHFLASSDGSQIAALTISAEISIGQDNKPALKLNVSDDQIRQDLVNHINDIALGYNNRPIRYSRDQYIVLGMQRLANIINNLAPTIQTSTQILEQNYTNAQLLGQFGYKGKPDMQQLINILIQHFITAYNQINLHKQIAAFTVLAEISIGTNDRKPALKLTVSDEETRKALVGFLNSIASGYRNNPIRFSKDNYIILGQERLANIINQLDSTLGLTSDSIQKHYTKAEDLGPFHYACQQSSPIMTMQTHAQFFHSNRHSPTVTQTSIESILINILSQQTAGFGLIATEGNSTWFQNQLCDILGKETLNDLKDGSVLSDVPEKLRNSSLKFILETRSDYLDEKEVLTEENKKEYDFIQQAMTAIDLSATATYTYP